MRTQNLEKGYQELRGFVFADNRHLPLSREHLNTTSQKQESGGVWRLRKFFLSLRLQRRTQLQNRLASDFWNYRLSLMTKTDTVDFPSPLFSAQFWSCNTKVLSYSLIKPIFWFGEKTIGENLFKNVWMNWRNGYDWTFWCKNIMVVEYWRISNIRITK